VTGPREPTLPAHVVGRKTLIGPGSTDRGQASAAQAMITLLVQLRNLIDAGTTMLI
jgi:hypothetical protein